MGLAVLGVVATAPQMLRADSGIPYITQAVVNYDANTLNISGAKLLGIGSSGIASVTVAATALTVQSSSANSITAAFPPSSPASSFAAGTYVLTVVFRNNGGEALFLVALGALGPQGPAGPAGAAGAQGPMGPIGPAGPAGSPGPQGPTGATGSQGPPGAQGAAGNAGPAGPAGQSRPAAGQGG